MPSLDKIYLRENNYEINKLNKMIKGLKTINLSTKLDGVSVLLHIKNNSYDLYTRGDGIKGRNITNICKHINFG